MDIDKYAKKLNSLEEATEQNFAELSSWAEKVALPWLWIELAGALSARKPAHPQARVTPPSPSLKPMSASDAVRKGIMCSVADRLTKDATAPFFHAQLTMMDSETRRYCKAISSVLIATNTVVPQATIHTLHGALRELLNYAQILLEDAGREVTGVTGYFGAWRSKRDHPFEVFKATEQIIYGAYSGMTHVDRAPYMPVSVLRTAIELRLRHAFGIYSWENPADPTVTVPIDMSTLFQAIETRVGEIEFDVDMHDIWKIYRWSNFYLHGGVRDFPWMAGFLLQYLRPLFVGQNSGPHRGWSISSGVRMKRATWHAIRAEIARGRERPSFTQRLVNAWRALFVTKRSYHLEIRPVEEKAAQCSFLD